MSDLKGITTNNIYIEAAYEIHIFLNPLNPSQEIVDKYLNAVNEWNKLNITNNKLKGCYLALVFNNNTTVTVMQSARYVYSDSFEYVKHQAENDASYFKNIGFDVLRIKIEANLPGIGSEIPENKNNYFESHIKIENGHTGEVGNEELLELIALSNKFTELYKVPIPLSYNKLKHPTGGCQRFLNIRFRYPVIRQEAEKIINSIINEIKNNTTWTYEKHHWEYIVYDTLPELDKGWIDF